jgi:16S rRNA C967 or C1407 C5-methylase (RsmB/RsmF family)
LKPGGELTYSVCTFGSDEGSAVVGRVLAARPDVELLDPPGDPWVVMGGMAVLLPDQTDGMMLARFRRPR